MQAEKSGEQRTPLAFALSPRAAQRANLAGEPRELDAAGRNTVTMPQARPLEGGVEIAGIGNERLPLSFEECNEPISRDTKKRAQ